MLKWLLLPIWVPCLILLFVGACVGYLALEYLMPDKVIKWLGKP